MSVTLAPGKRDATFNCIDLLGCGPLVRSIGAAPTSEGLRFLGAWWSGDGWHDARFSSRDGAYIIGDGLPHWSGLASAGLWEPRAFDVMYGPDVWTPFLSGGGTADTASQWETGLTSYAIRIGDTIVSEGPLAGFPLGKRVFLPDAELRVSLRLAYEDAPWGDTTTTLRYHLEFPTTHRDSHPAIHWARVTDARGVAATFSPTEPLELHVKAVDGGTPLSVTLTLGGPAGQVATQYVEPGPDGLVHLAVPSWGPGAYVMEAVAVASDGERVEMTLDPVLVVSED